MHAYETPVKSTEFMGLLRRNDPREACVRMVEGDIQQYTHGVVVEEQQPLQSRDGGDPILWQSLNRGCGLAT